MPFARRLSFDDISFPVASRLAIAVLATFYFFSAALDPMTPRFLNSIDLVFHEAGHTIATFFPIFITIAAGTLMQLAVPLALSVYFFRRDSKYSGALLLFWLGQSLMNVSVYAGDAVAQALPLLGGEAVIHDWNYLLSTTHLLPHTALVSGVVYWSGLIVTTAASMLAIFFALPERRVGLSHYAGAVVLHAGAVLVVRGDGEGLPPMWSLPVGPVAADEEPSEAARREIQEQTGIIAGFAGVPTAVVTSSDDMRSSEPSACPIRLHLFQGAMVGGGLRRGTHVAEVKWVPLSEAGTLPYRSSWMGPLVLALTKDGGSLVQVPPNVDVPASEGEAVRLTLK